MRNPSSASISSSSSPSSKVPKAPNTTTAAAGSTSNKTTPCCIKVGIKRGPWTPEEDDLLSAYIKREGEGRWRTLPKKAGLLRCGKSCRLRWMNYLRPSVKRGHIAPDEEDLILRLHRLLSKKLISQGIDPRTHKPLEPSSSSNNETKANQVLADPSSSSYEPSPLAPIKDVARNGSSSTPTVGREYDVNMQNIGDDHGDGTYGMDLRSSQEGLSNEDDEDMNYCTDDIFSSFLNSLINEDDFNTQNLVQQQQLQQQPNNLISTDCDALISSTPAFNFGPGWDAPVAACTPSFDQNDSKRLNEQVEKQF